MTEQSLTPKEIELATELTIAWLGNANDTVSPEEVTEFLNRIHATLQGLKDGSGPAVLQEEQVEFEPATTVKRSLASREYIISMIDGKPYKTLRRHLATHGLTPEQYRERYNLKPDYPMVAPAYSEARSSMARKIGLGQMGRAARDAQARAAERSKAAAQPRKRRTSRSR